MAESASDDSDTGELSWTFYRDRPEWSDVTPIPQDDGPHPIVRIAYTEKFTDVYDYFRAIIWKEEKSLRALALTKDAIKLNPANYTVWHYRRLILKELNCDLAAELDYITAIIKAHPKNYQVWYHRQVIVQWLNDPSRELEFTASILNEDAKNYHAWQHRQWAIRTFSLWVDELKYVEQLLEEDVRNNSAWNQRFFVISNTTDFTADVVDREIKFCFAEISKATNNESAWNYLRGVLSSGNISDHPDVRRFCEELYSQGSRTNHLLSMLVDMYEEELMAGGCGSAALDQAVQLCALLATEVDTIRAGYWTFIQSQLENKFRESTKAM